MADILPERIGSSILPKSLFKKNFAFGIDYGSTLIKVVYTTEEDDNLHMHFVHFPRQQTQEAIEFLKKECAGKLNPEEVYTVTGVGIAEHLKSLESALGVKGTIRSEHCLLASTFVFRAKHQSWKDLVHPVNTELKRTMKVATEALCLAIDPLFERQGTGFQFHDADELLKDNKNVQYPALVVLLGSAQVIFKVDADASLKLCDYYATGGRSLLGLGYLLPCRAQSFDELMTQASKGNASAVNQDVAALGASEDNTAYGGLSKSNSLVNSYGLAASDKHDGTSDDIDKFKKEDIAAALVASVSHTLAQNAFNWSMTENIKQVFMTGSLSNSEPFRNKIEQEFLERCYGNMKAHAADCFFIKAGGHMPAIGSLLMNLGVLDMW